jgi:hypothetical protein
MTIREVFDELAGGGDADPAGALADRGYGELPDPLLSEAIVSYADTAPVEVAEHLSPFVMVHSAVPVDRVEDAPASDGLELLATAPEPIVLDDQADDEATEPEAAEDLSYQDDFAFEFGSGSEEALAAWDVETPEPAFAGPALELDEPAEEYEPDAGSWLARPEPVAADQEPEDDSDGGDAGA